ncbi:MAG: PqqD family protein [Nitriliruptoraceae bacterium]|nr:PqqD family protein [Nitriliruptoraceae bacterium]
MAKIEMSSVVQRRDALFANELSRDETVMLDVERGRYFGVRDVGKAIWDRLEQPVQIEQLCADLTETYEVEPEQCAADVVAFLAQLDSQGLIDVSPGG